MRLFCLVIAYNISKCSQYFFPAAAQVQLGFEEADNAVSEGRNDEFFLRIHIGDLNNDAVLRLIPLTVSGFQDYRNANPDRTFTQETIAAVAAIANPAECEQ